MFKKILIANRGEIAVRVIRACHEMGIAAVAVYSDVDRAALHVRKADEAYPIGAAAAAESYLNIQKILDVAARSGADAIHPGYGFLSENAKFARACADAGVKFIGPTAAAMDAMGSKTQARQAMERAGVPIVPGTSRGLESFEQAEEVAARIGYPVMLKAAAGGGGKGMRLVHAARGFEVGARRRAQRGGAFVRRRRSLYREGDRQSAPHRDADSRRRAREHGLSRRARVFDPAASSEGGRGSAVADCRCRHAAPNGRSRGARGAGCGIHERGHGRIPGRRAEEFLFPRDEYALAGGASSDGTGDRTRSGALADSHRGRREAAFYAE